MSAAAMFGNAIVVAPAAAAVFGILGNFDVTNDTGQIAHGFEIDLEGIHGADVTDTFGGAGRGFPSGRGFDPSVAVERYGAPTISDYSNGAVFGTKVTYRGLFDATAGVWDFGTPSGSFVTPGDNCWTGGGLGYSASTPCDHFGVGTTANPTRTTYNWLLESSTPGVLTNGTVNLPAPQWTVLPPAIGAPPDAPPIVVAVIVAPDPLEGSSFGDALWVKVFTTESDQPVELEDLIGGQPMVNAAEQNTEIEWQLLQKEQGNALSGMLENDGGGPVGANAEAVIRRYEFYAYSGEYSAEHEALLINGDTSPDASELGSYMGAQNGAVNLAPAVPVDTPIPAIGWLFVPGMLGLFALRRRSNA